MVSDGTEARLSEILRHAKTPPRKPLGQWLIDNMPRGIDLEIPSRHEPERAVPFSDGEAYYWRERNREVDFVVRAGNRLVAIEVKSGRAGGTLAGMAVFSEAFRPMRKLLVGGDGIDIETFLLKPVEDWLKT